MIHVLIVALGSPDLLELALCSLNKYVTNYRVSIEHLTPSTTDARAHGLAINQWRYEQRGEIRDTDVVVIMDPDVVILSYEWQRELDHVLADPTVGIWGAGSKEDFGPRVHASMMAIRGRLWNTLPVTFLPCPDPRERTWRDTGGVYCLMAVDAGWQVVPVERDHDWRGEFSCWRVLGVPMWTHLGGGSHSDPARMTWLQRIKRWRVVNQRGRFKRLVQENLCS